MILYSRQRSCDPPAVNSVRNRIPLYTPPARGCAMAAPSERERISRLETRAREAENALQQVKNYLELLRKKAAEPDVAAVKAEAKQLEEENQQLRTEVQQLRQRLVELEIRNGAVQVPVPSTASITPTPGPIVPPPTQPLATPTQSQEAASEPLAAVNENKKAEGTEKEKGAEGGKKGKREKKEKTANNQRGASGGEGTVIDVSRLDFRIGKIITAKRHPEADTLYIEEIDIGEEKPRTVCSGLVKHVPMEQLQDEMVVMLCNLKPAKMRGVLSEAMVMCASSPENVEILDPPAGSVPGERITFQGYTGTPDAQLNPKKKIFEQIQPDLLTSDEGVACYKGVPFTVEGKGVCRAPTMRNSGIK